MTDSGNAVGVHVFGRRGYGSDGAKHPKAVASLRLDGSELLAFFDFPAEHWVHLRIPNVIESATADCQPAANFSFPPNWSF